MNRTQRFPHFLLWVSECTEFRDNRALRLRYHSKMSLQFRSRPALVAYLTCGDPDLCTSREVALAAISAGAEVIELGVPFSDPVADGPVIQRATERAHPDRAQRCYEPGAGEQDAEQQPGQATQQQPAPQRLKEEPAADEADLSLQRFTR